MLRHRFSACLQLTIFLDRYHFDSLVPALLATMMVTTLDGWVEIFHTAADACKVDYQPSQNCNVSTTAGYSRSF